MACSVASRLILCTVWKLWSSISSVPLTTSQLQQQIFWIAQTNYKHVSIDVSFCVNVCKDWMLQSGCIWAHLTIFMFSFALFLCVSLWMLALLCSQCRVYNIVIPFFLSFFSLSFKFLQILCGSFRLQIFKMWIGHEIPWLLDATIERYICDKADS